jgi:hypothetical protein
MADENPTGRASLDPESPAIEDRKTESAILALLLDEHPTRLTFDEMALAVRSDADRGDPDDKTQRAVRELIGAGLVHRHDTFLAPTRAALYFAALEMA